MKTYFFIKISYIQLCPCVLYNQGIFIKYKLCVKPVVKEEIMNNEYSLPFMNPHISGKAHVKANYKLSFNVLF